MEKKLVLTETMEEKLRMMVSEPAYMADGRKVPDKTGWALKARGLAYWDAEAQAWLPTYKGREEVWK